MEGIEGCRLVLKWTVWICELVASEDWLSWWDEFGFGFRLVGLHSFLRPRGLSGYRWATSLAGPRTCCILGVHLFVLLRCWGILLFVFRPRNDFVLTTARGLGELIAPVAPFFRIWVVRVHFDGLALPLPLRAHHFDRPELLAISGLLKLAREEISLCLFQSIGKCIPDASKAESQINSSVLTYVHPGTLFEGEEVEKGGDMMQSVMMVEFG